MRRPRPLWELFLRTLHLDEESCDARAIQKVRMIAEQIRINSLRWHMYEARHGIRTNTDHHVEMVFMLLVMGTSDIVRSWPGFEFYPTLLSEAEKYKSDWLPLMRRIVCGRDSDIERARLVNDVIDIGDKFAARLRFRIFTEMEIDDEPWAHEPRYDLDPEVAAIAG